MGVGRSDVILIGPLYVSAGDIILAACRRAWPDCLFQDVNEDDLHKLDEKWVWEEGTARHEFFVYRDGAAVSAWEAHGAVPENSNTMLHFLIRAGEIHGDPVSEVTCVCDARAGAAAEIIREIETGLQFAMLDARKVA